ncbi:cytochrome b-c1 complex subunit 8 isoform X1 [Carassius gibelio]|uniref:cytochrome b-c1 complex subunit 8 isoform X1 n=2 Tax=Carassius gibelio TaxID=101364 RepID=UPI002277E661|nr:cytochrome b-c1 complex subunit 8 isoform X1 [Carassius gibelio]
MGRSLLSQDFLHWLWLQPISFFGAMGRHFGDLAKIRHVITYTISPFEQRAFPNYFSKGIPNVWRRFKTSVFKVAPPMVLMYLTYTWGNRVHEQTKRKNPADYEDDK